MYTAEALLSASHYGKAGRSQILTSSEAYVRSKLTKDVVVVSSRDMGVFFFTTDHCFGVNVLPDNFIPCTSVFPQRVKERPGLEDGVIDTIEKYIQIFESGMCQIHSIEELLDHLNQHVA